MTAKLASRSAPTSLRLALLLLTAPFWGACGGGGGGGTAEVPAQAPDSVSVSVTTLDANFNSPLSFEGTTFTGPVTCRLLDANDEQVGPNCPGVVSADGTRVDMESPLLPDLAEDMDVTVELRGADGRRARGDRPVRVRASLGARAIDGSGNNSDNPGWGAASTALREDVGRAYGDGVSTPGGAARPNVRTVSNEICAQSEDLPNAANASDVFWLWGQFLDHDIDLTPEADPAEDFAIQIPLGDTSFDPFFTGTATMSLHRSTWELDTGTDAGNPRRQTNVITSYIDASNVYGSDAGRAAALRTLDGTGRLRTSAGDRLPFNTEGLANAPTAFDPSFFLAGDVRANENVALTAMPTIWVREHNRTADDIRARNGHLTGDQIYEAARRWVGAEMQVITVREFLPRLLGNRPLGRYTGYRADVDASIGVYFSTAAYRFGHSMVSAEILRIGADGNEVADGPLAIRDAFFNPSILQADGVLEDVLRGVAGKAAQEMDPYVVDDLRNFLFGPPGAGGLDLAALNLQRGRDHGLPDYNACRAAYGLAPNLTFADVTNDTEKSGRLEAAYGATADMDVWVAALAEDHVPGAVVGPLLHACFREQFRRLRDGDRYWYENLYRGAALAQLERTRLADVIRRNSEIGAELSDDVFRAADGNGGNRITALTSLTGEVASDTPERSEDELRTLLGRHLLR